MIRRTNGSNGHSHVTAGEAEDFALPGAEMLRFGASGEEADIAAPRVQEALLYASKWKGSKGQEGFRRCRELLYGAGETPQPNEFLRPMFDAKLSLFACGFIPVIPDATKKIIQSKAPWFQAEARRLALECMREYLICDNAAAVWFKGQKRASDKSTIVGVLKTQDVVDFQNSGVESLTIKPEKRTLSEQEKEQMNERWATAIEKGEKITLDPEEGEFFAVATAANRGHGLAAPSLLGSLDALMMLDALRVGDMTGAMEARQITKHWVLGYEPRNGDRQYLDSVIRLASPKKAKALQDTLKRKKGRLVELITPWYAKLIYDHLDTKFFDAAKYTGSLMRLRLWGGAVAALLEKDAPESARDLAFAQAKVARDEVGRMLETIFNHRAYGLGLNAKNNERVTVAWSPVPFMEPKTRKTTLEGWVNRGIISVETYREWLGIDSDFEAARLTGEASQITGYRPNWEPAQGNTTASSPGADHGGSASPDNGRPAGT